MSSSEEENHHLTDDDQEGEDRGGKKNGGSLNTSRHSSASSSRSPSKNGRWSSQSPDTPVSRKSMGMTGPAPTIMDGSKSPPPSSSSTSSSLKPRNQSMRTGSKSPKTPRETTSSSKSGSSSSARGGKKHSGGPKKKCINFKRTVGVHSIPNLDTYSIAEKDLTWYAPDDYGAMEDECDLTAELLDRRKPLWPGHCPRGLEAWTQEGEQRKEGHVQLAIDIVWQAQLEQWKASSDVSECWEFIRSRYLAVSEPCHKLAHKRGLADEQEVQTYLSGVRSVERNRQRLLGLHTRRRGRPVGSSGDSAALTHETPRSSSSKKKVGRTYSEFSSASATPMKSPPSRNHSSDNIHGPKKGLLKHTTDDDVSVPSVTAGSKIKHKPVVSDGTIDADDVSQASSNQSGSAAAGAAGNRKKISYQPKSKSKVPVSPVASLVTDTSDGDSTNRRLRSHMSVNSDDSTRRRMLRSVNIKPPLDG